jgi:hypothetical protein
VPNEGFLYVSVLNTNLTGGGGSGGVVNNYYSTVVTGGTTSIINNITVSGAGGGGVAISAGTNSKSSGVVSFGNSNGITFGMDTAGVVTATVVPGAAAGIAAIQMSDATYTSGTAAFFGSNAVTVRSTTGGGVVIDSPVYQTTGNYLTTAANSTHSHGNPTLYLTNLTGTTASASNGLSLSLSAAAPGAGGGIGMIYGTATQTSGNVVLSGSGGISVVASAGTAVISFDGHHLDGLLPSGNGYGTGFSSMTSGTVGLSAGQGVSFSQVGNVLGIQVATNYQSPGAYLTTARASNDAVGLNSALTANGVSATINSSGLSLNFPAFLTTAQAPGAYLTTARASNDAIGLNTALTANGVSWTVGSSGISLNVPAFLTTAQSPGAYLTTAMVSNAGSNFVGLNSALTANGVSASINSSGVSLNFPAFLTTAAQSGHSHGNPTLALTNLSGTTASASNGFTLSLAAPAPGGGAAQTFSAGTTNQAPNPIYFSDGNGVSFGFGAGASTNVLTASIPSDFTCVMWEPMGLVTGSAFSSHPPATSYFMPMPTAEAIAFRNLYGVKSISIGVPAGSSSNTQQTFVVNYKHEFKIFKRKDNAGSSLSLTHVMSGSLGITYSFVHTSTSMVASLIYQTNSAGGTTSQSTTSNATAGLAAFFNGARIFQVPCAPTTLSAGEYWVMQGHSSTNASTAGTASLLFNVSNLHIAPQFAGGGLQFLGSTNATSAHVGYLFPNIQGVANAITTNADMNYTAISNGTVNHWYCNLGNF